MRFRAREQPEPQDPIAAQYVGPKVDLRSNYERLVTAARAPGPDVELAPRKTYAARVRGQQFALIQPSTRTRVDLGRRLKGQEATDRLQEGAAFGSGSITYKVALADVREVNEQVMGWLKQA